MSQSVFENTKYFCLPTFTSISWVYCVSCLNRDPTHEPVERFDLLHFVAGGRYEQKTLRGSYRPHTKRFSKPNFNVGSIDMVKALIDASFENQSGIVTNAHRASFVSRLMSKHYKAIGSANTTIVDRMVTFILIHCLTQLTHCVI